MPRSPQSELFQRIGAWFSEHLEHLAWTGLWLFACLLFVLAFGLVIASRTRCVVILSNDAAAAIHDVSLRPAAASSREPKHFLAHLEPGVKEEFVIYPLGPSSVLLNYLDSQGKNHHWEGGRVAPRGGRLQLHLRMNGEIAASS
jgi:hypothetical protein